MRKPVPEAAMPSLAEQLAMLSPVGKIVGGVLMFGLGAAGFAIGSASLGNLILVGVGAALGVPLLLRGLRERADERAAADELARARDELPALREAVAEARADKRGIDRFLRDRGYSSAKVRRWIALECDIVLPREEG